MFSMADLPTIAVTFLISSNHCFMDAVTAFCTWTRSEGKEDNICWYNGVCVSDVNGIECMSSRDLREQRFSMEKSNDYRLTHSQGTPKPAFLDHVANAVNDVEKL